MLRHKMNANLFFAIILVCISPLTTEVFAPAMTSAAKMFNIEIVELSVSVYFLVMACLHLINGYFVYKYGEFCTALYGIILFIISCSFLLFSNESKLFIGIRGFQAIGSSACTVVGFAHIRSHLNPRVHIPITNTIRGVLLIIAPMTSEFVINIMNEWQICFIILIGLGIVALILLKFAFASEGNKSIQHNILKYDTRKFICWIVADAFSFSAVFMWICYAPFFCNTSNFGYWYGLTFTGSVIGSVASKWFHANDGFLFGSLLMIAMTCISLLFSSNASIIFICMSILNLGRGIAASHAQTQALITGKPYKYINPSGILHSVRMVVTSACITIATLNTQTAWLTMLTCECVAMFIIIISCISDKYGILNVSNQNTEVNNC